MVSWLVSGRKQVVAFTSRLRSALGTSRVPAIFQLGYFVVLSFAVIPLVTLSFLLELPLHFRVTSTKGFEEAAIRSDNGCYLESYNGYLRRMRASVMLVMTTVIFVALQFYALGYGVWKIFRPTKAEAYTASVTLNPTWDRTAIKYITKDGVDPECVPPVTSYSCDNAAATTLSAYSDNQGANPCPWVSTFKRAAMKFSLTSIPDNATITNSELIVNVATAFDASTPSIIRSNTDGLDALSCTTAGGLWNSSTAGTTYATPADWNTTGVKTVDLGATADSEIQTRLTGSDILPLALSESSSISFGAINSVDAASNKPQLRVTYTLPPQAPTGTSHSGNTTSTVNWTWMDNATAETRYDVHDASHANVTGCTNLAANSQSCAETGLSANTQYTRHPNVTDAQGNTDGPDASAYASIETPTGIIFGTVGTTSIAVSASGTLTNLSSGSSGLYFQESVTATNSGWTQTNSWPKSGLTANTQYSFQAKARNGNTDETSLTSAATKYTLSATPNVTSTRSASTWYTSGVFPFTNAASWGAGGVQYYRYVWDTNAAHSFTGSESTWSDANAKCPGGTCTDAGTTLNKAATSDSNSWYLHVQSFNAEDSANGSGTNYGPYYFDGANPTTPAMVNDGTGADATYTTSLTTLSANWTASTDTTSGLQKYQYAIGTTPGGIDVVGWTDNSTGTTVTKGSLSLASGTTYYVSVRAVDNAGNTGSSTSSNGVTVNTSLPSITDNQTGDLTPRKSSGTTYDVDFAKAPTGPQLDYAQYAVYSGSGKTGTLLKDWTNIFTTDTDSYATNWSVDSASLQEGTNYVSVKVVALDTLSAELDDAFTIVKDTVAPAISSFTAAPTTTAAVLNWTTNEPATAQIEYGLTSAYGTTTTLDSTLTTAHTVTISGLANNTTFHARALGSDQAGNTALSADLSFATAAGVHTLITNVQVTAVSSTAVTVTWTTNEPATSKVRYGSTTDYGLEVSDSTLVTGHSVSLTGLTPGATYHYEVLSVGSTSTNDADATFTTTTAIVPAPTPPASTVATPTISNSAELVLTADTAPTIVGTGPAGGTIFVVVDRVLVRTVLVGPDGKYFVDLSKALSLGTHAIVVRAKDVNGRVSEESAPLTITVTKGSVGTTVIWRNVTDGAQPSITLGAVAPVNATVKILIDATVVKTINTTSSAPPSFGFITTITPPSSLSVGKHTVSLVTVNSNGRPSVPTGITAFTKTAAGPGTNVILRYEQPTTYVVQAGDSLWKIAQELFGDGRQWTDIQAANVAAHPSLESQPQLLRVGWQLTIPTGK
ncbi:MAG: fibronectin type III domain-containing protein [Patescibacteria group bacterium]